MSLSEFELIRKYFLGALPDAPGIIQGIGDDAAVMRIPADQELVLSMDTLIAGVHFPEQTPAEDIGYKSLAVNLSDLAAMGAEPRWITLSLTLPECNETWLQDFMRGFSELARQYSLALIGGDISKGPLSITVQVHGWVPAGRAIYRHGAQAGDLVYVSGTLGDAGLALRFMQDKITGSSSLADIPLVNRLFRPVPRIELGINLRGVASAAIDISDGLIADLGHILSASHTGAEVHIDQLPMSDVVSNHEDCINLALASGDDYELCFTVPPSHNRKLQGIPRDFPITCIGRITRGTELEWLMKDGTRFNPDISAYHHF